MEGPRDPSLLPPCSLKISGDCLYSADFPLVPFQRELRWKSIHSQTAPFQIPLGLAGFNLESAWGGHCPPPFLPQLWFFYCHPYTLSFNLGEETQVWGRGWGLGGILILFLLSSWRLPRRELKFCPGNKTWRERCIPPSPPSLPPLLTTANGLAPLGLGALRFSQEKPLSLAPLLPLPEPTPRSHLHLFKT